GQQVGVLVTPNVTHEIARHIAPGVNRGIGDDLAVVVKDEAEPEGAQISDEGCRKRNREESAPFDILPAGMAHTGPVSGGSARFVARAKEMRTSAFGAGSGIGRDLVLLKGHHLLNQRAEVISDDSPAIAASPGRLRLFGVIHVDAAAGTHDLHARARVPMNHLDVFSTNGKDHRHPPHPGSVGNWPPSALQNLHSNIQMASTISYLEFAARRRHNGSGKRALIHNLSASTGDP